MFKTIMFMGRETEMKAGHRGGDRGRGGGKDKGNSGRASETDDHRAER